MVIDCTIRDGGYYVNWDFCPDTIRKYLASVVVAKIDIIEIGFRFLPRNKFFGAFAYSTDEYLNSINIPDELSIAVMVNASELIEYEHGVHAAVAKLFSPKSESLVDIVRIAVSVKSAYLCQEIVKELHNLGYRVFLNLMQIDAVDDHELYKISCLISSWRKIEVLYFADSFGNLDQDSVRRIVSSVKKGWSGNIGFHAHDNKGLALSNSLVAKDVGVQYVDSTLCGMGRGAGNTKTELLLVELGQRDLGEYFPDALFSLVLKDFNKLQQQYQWGASIYYHLSATYGIHPSYIQEMLGDDRYDTEQILSAINFLKATDASFFSFESMLRASAGIEGDEKGTWSAAGWLKERKVLILGSGQSTKKYIEALRLFIDKNNPFVMCLNINEEVPADMVDAYVSCHDTRILIESDKYAKLNKPIILPLTRLPERIHAATNKANILDYGLRIDEKCFSITAYGCVLPSPLAIAYAISLATAAGAKEILMTGVDGYKNSDIRQLEVENMFRQYKKRADAVTLTAITPTTYPINQSSLFMKFGD